MTTAAETGFLKIDLIYGLQALFMRRELKIAKELPEAARCSRRVGGKLPRNISERVTRPYRTRRRPCAWPQCSDFTAFVAFSTYPSSRLVHSRRSIENGDYKFLVAPNTR